ncbi:MAG TPA: STAS domain-containing protein [Vicinamibacterales bacterium]|nr:STAS domain-containing protein [Vicinamibacterales bacterium]
MRDTQRWGLRVERVAGSADDTIAVGGRLSRATAPRLAEALEEAIAGGGRRIVLDLGGLDYLNSAGLQVLGEISARLAAIGGALVLMGAQPPVRIALELGGIPNQT